MSLPRGPKGIPGIVYEYNCCIFGPPYDDDITEGYEIGVEGDLKFIYYLKDELEPVLGRWGNDPNYKFLAGVVLGAASKGNRDVIDLFREMIEGSEFKDSLIFEAVLGGHYELAHELISEYALDSDSFNETMHKLILEAPPSDVGDIIYNMGDKKQYYNYLLFTLERGDAKVINSVSRSASPKDRVEAIRELLDSDVSAIDKLRLINIISDVSP